MTQHKVFIEPITKNKRIVVNAATRAAAWCTCGESTPQTTVGECEKWRNEKHGGPPGIDDAAKSDAGGHPALASVKR